jgi:hypothetical protein
MNDSDQHNDNGKSQQDMNKITHRLTGQRPEQLQKYQHNDNVLQYIVLLSNCGFPLPANESSCQPAGKMHLLRIA